MSDTDMTLSDTPASRTAVPDGFVHDAEHPQIPVPFTAVIGDRRMEGRSLSVTGAVVTGLLPPNAEGGVRPVTLRFDFEGFSTNLYPEVRVLRLGNEADATYELRFTDPTAGHLAPLRYILNSAIAGDLVSIGQMLGYTGPTKVKAQPPKVQRGFAGRAGNGFKRFAILGLSVGLLLVAGQVIHNRVMFSYEGQPVMVSVPGETLRSTAAGQITYVNPDAGAGDVIYSISANSGDFLSVEMPCDCELEPLPDFYEGATILPGTALVKLVEADAGLEARTQISFEGVARMFAGDSAELVLASGDVVPVTVALMQGEAAEPGDTVPADLTLPDNVAGTLQPGTTARLRFRRHLLPDWLGGTWKNAGTRIGGAWTALVSDLTEE
ncbi:hypothetical protein [Psychromarinibacter sp. S121]|uniref:hypothetical protein n=1 Tax=Psychromarinibacter sp. S121 TaxID=3415127 RepID=UPI003C7C9C1D